MAFAVMMTDDAARDLREIYEYVGRHDAPAKADRLLDHIERILARLYECPERGAYVKELLGLGIREYREVFFKPYRIIYAIRGETVYILLIADGRRDMQTLLQRRLLAP